MISNTNLAEPKANMDTNDDIFQAPTKWYKEEIKRDLSNMQKNLQMNHPSKIKLKFY